MYSCDSNQKAIMTDDEVKLKFKDDPEGSMKKLRELQIDDRYVKANFDSRNT